MTRNIGIAAMIIGLLSALTGALWNTFFPTADANIGAGGLVVLGLPFACIGLVVLIVSTLWQRRNPGPKRVG